MPHKNWPEYEDGLRIIDQCFAWPKTTRQLSDAIGATPDAIRKAARSLLKHAPYSKNGALIIWCRMNGQGQNERYVEVLGYDPWKHNRGGENEENSVDAKLEHEQEEKDRIYKHYGITEEPTP